MEKTNKTLTSVELVSKKVLDAKGRLVGTVKDVFFQPGKSESSLTVECKDGKIQIIEWSSIQGASDFIVLKPAGQSAHELRAKQKTKPLTSVELVSKNVLDVKGRLVGTVKDVVFQAGKSESSLSVEGKDGKIQIIEWSSIQGASDFIVLKPVGQSAHELRAKQKASQTVPQQQSSLKNPFRLGSLEGKLPSPKNPKKKPPEQETSQTVPQQQSSEKSRFRLGVGRQAPESQESNRRKLLNRKPAKQLPNNNQARKVDSV